MSKTHNQSKYSEMDNWTEKMWQVQRYAIVCDHTDESGDHMLKLNKPKKQRQIIQVLTHT